MKNIVISQRQDFISSRNETRDSIDTSWHYLLYEIGIEATLVPNIFKNYENLEKWIKKTNPIGVILSGGNDIGQSVNRDQTESLLLQYAKNNNLPLLGVCRGAQMMIKFDNGKLEKIDGHVGTRHKIYFENFNSWEVNSYHNLAIKKIPKNYTCLAKTKDGSIEYLKHNTLPWYGIMWHPEREVPFANNDKELLRFCFEL